MQQDFHTMDKALIKFTVQCLVWGFLRAEATRESERASNEKVAQDQASEAIFNMVVSFTADECNEEDKALDYSALAQPNVVWGFCAIGREQVHRKKTLFWNI